MTSHIFLVLPILGVLIGITAAYFTRFDPGERESHRTELKHRLNLMWLAAWGNDYTQPRFDVGDFSHMSFDDPQHAEDPVLAMLVRSSEAEARWYALHHLLDHWEDEEMHRIATTPEQERMIHDYITGRYHDAYQEAREAIESRLELHQTEDDEDDLVWRYVITDPATGYRQVITMSERDLMRFEPGKQGMPPQVESRIERFPDSLMAELEHHSSDLNPRVNA